MADALEIRKAFEVALANAITAAYGAGTADPQNAANMVAWPNQDFDPKPKDLYVRPTLHGPRSQPRTLGPDPAVTRRGFFKVGCFLKSGLRQDPLDSLAKVVVAAYPYGTDLTAGGAIIQIEEITEGDPLTPPGWLYKPVDINWRINI